MLSDILSGFCPVERTVFESEGYLLARVKIDEKPFFAEVTPASSPASGKWPGVPGVVLPVNQRGLPDGYSLLLFPDSGEEFVCERLRFETLDIESAILLCIRISDIVRALHSQGRYIGYIGPESILVSRSGRPQILGGRRGVPDNPFSAPEAVGRPATDPRSDVFALGSLLFRMIAGSTRDRQDHIRIWNGLPDSLRQLIHRMVGESPVDRFPGVSAMRKALAGYRSEPPERKDGVPEETPEKPFSSGRKPWRRRSSPLAWIVLAIAAVLAGVLIFADPFGGGPTGDGPAGPGPGTVPDTVSTQWTDELPDQPSGPGPAVTDTVPDRDSAVVWVTNSTGSEGAARTFRAGPAASWSLVYTTTGTARRSSSVILCRRTDVSLPPSEQPLLPLALDLASADSTMVILPVDLTILLGTDLYYDGVNREYLTAPSAPAGTLYVDVANNGIQYTLGGMGAATWTAATLDGRSLRLDGEEWVLSVTDFRDGDRQSEELGIPELLETTVFLYREDSPVCRAAEEQIRLALQALPDGAEGPPAGLPVPDIWVHLGTPSGD